MQIGGVYSTFCQGEGILLQKYRDRNWRSIAMLFESIGVRGRCDSSEKESGFQKRCLSFKGESNAPTPPPLHWAPANQTQNPNLT